MVAAAHSRSFFRTMALRALQARAFGITFVGYSALHLVRRSLSVVKVRINQLGDRMGPTCSRGERGAKLGRVLRVIRAMFLPFGSGPRGHAPGRAAKPSLPGAA